MSKARILADYVAGGTTAAEFDYMDGVTSNVQTQMNTKAPLASPAFTGTPTGITAAHITSGVLPVGVTGGSGLKGVTTAITEADTWRVTTLINGSANPVTSGWERDDSDNNVNMGTGMTESSGLFSFPSTGVWLVYFATLWAIPSSMESRTLRICIQVAPAGTSDWSDAASGMAQGEFYQSNQSYQDSTCQKILDVTTSGTSGVRVRFEHETENSGVNSSYDTNSNSGPHAMFIRLGDT